MPTYEYICSAGHAFEAFQKISERPKSKCPKCGKPATRKISGGAGLVFKGSGFYITDYRSKSYKEQQKKESGAPAPAKDEPKSKPKPKEGAPKTH
jgi:putative FmdB family regulatory protein